MGEAEGKHPGGGAAAHRGEYVLTKEWAGEQERLKLLETTVDPFSVEAIRSAGLRPGWRCLEIGAGSGSIARWLAQQTGDPALVVATDIDPRLLGPLERDGIEVLRHDVVVDDFPLGFFDLIHTRTVLEHVAQREDVLDRVARWLAPEGVLVVVDCMSFPVFSDRGERGLAQAATRCRRSRRDRGGTGVPDRRSPVAGATLGPVDHGAVSSRSASRRAGCLPADQDDSRRRTRAGAVSRASRAGSIRPGAARRAPAYATRRRAPASRRRSEPPGRTIWPFA